FVPVGMVSGVAYALVSRKDLPQASLKEVIDFARANPRKLTYASAGVGTGQHIIAAALVHLTGVEVVHVPYRGAQAAYQDLLAGRVDLFFDNAATAKPYLDSGQVKGYAVSTAARWPALPQLPTVIETGVAKLELESWFAIFARAGTPPAILERLRVEMAKVVQTPELAERFEKGGNRMLKMTPAEAEAFVRSEVEKWPSIIRQAGITAQ
ncbi:MAG: Bug family tripartite tricarboxylate transporter substrate binding protein, partial [Gammaproteobacteria bacterium]